MIVRCLIMVCDVKLCFIMVTCLIQFMMEACLVMVRGKKSHYGS